MKVAAFANCNVAFIAWSISTAIPDCLGFSVRRIDTETGKKDVLPSWVPFAGQDNKDWKPRSTDVWPIQRFSWKDFVGKQNKTYEYEIVPMVGKFDALVAREDLAGRSNAITLSTDCGDHIQACFTSGILSTQALTRKLPKNADGSPSFEALTKAITTPGDPIREKLSGGMIKFLLQLIAQAKKDGGKVDLALYELADPELVQALLDDKDFVEILLGNTGKDDLTNKDARAKLHAAGAKITDRMLQEGSIAHNKFGVYRDKNDIAKSVITGSTNWTATGLTCQSNNAVIIESDELAKLFQDCYKLLELDNAAQGPALRTANATRKSNVALADGTDITVWFAPNMTDRTKPSKNAALPPDLAEVFDLMDKAKDQILFLAFYPGFPSIISKVESLSQSRHNLVLRGVVNNAQAMGANGAKLYHRKGTPPVMVTASALEKQLGAWEKELLKLPDAHAIVHDKIIVIDPLSDECVVVLGSHNLGYKASYGNDENLLIIKGNKKLAAAFMVHILDVYDHYRFRYMQRGSRSGWKGVLKTDATWQDRFFIGATFEEMHMWTGDAVKTKDEPEPGPDTVPVPVPESEPDSDGAEQEEQAPTVPEPEVVEPPAPAAEPEVVKSPAATPEKVVPIKPTPEKAA